MGTVQEKLPGNDGKGIFVNMGAEEIWRKLLGVSLWQLGFCVTQGSSQQQSRALAAPLSHWSLWISLPWGTKEKSNFTAADMVLLLFKTCT